MPTFQLALSNIECYRTPAEPTPATAAPAGQTNTILDTREGKGPTVSISIKPLEDRIVVKALEAEQTTASGLVIPDTVKEKPQEGEVMAAGPGRWNEAGDERVPLDVAVGDRVIYSKYGGTEIKHDGQDYLILSARDVLATVGS